MAEAVDVLQIPAFLCRQTDLLVAAGKSGRAVNIKKGQFVSPWDMRHAVEKVREAGGERVFLTERGAPSATTTWLSTCGRSPSCAILRRWSSTRPIRCSLPSAGAANGDGTPVQSGGQPEFIPLLARAAVAAGVDGVFVEVHDNPAQAKSDGANALDLKLLPELIDQLIAVHEALN